MATVDKYKIVIDVEGDKKILDMKQSILGLGTAIASIGFGAFIAGAFKMADAMKDIADATGISVGYVKAFSESLQQAGGSADDAGKVLTKFYQSIDDAAQGSDKAQKAFAKVHVTLDDLRNLSEQDLLKKTLDGLAKMKPGAERTAVAMDLLSKAFNTVDPTQLLAALDTKNVDAYNESFTKAAEITQAFTDNVNILKSATVDVLSSLIGDVDNFKISADKAREVVKILAGLLAGAFAAATVAGIFNVIKAFNALRTAMKGAAIAQIALTAAGGPIGVASLAAGVAAAALAYSYLDKKLAEVDASAQDTAASLAATGATPGATPAGGVGRTVEDSDRVKKMQDQARAAAETTRQLRQQIDQTRTLRALDLALLDVDQDRAAAIRDYLNIATTTNAKIAALEAQITAERAKGVDTNKAVITQLQQQIRLTEQQAAEAVKARQEDEKRLEIQKRLAAGMQGLYQYEQTIELLSTENGLNQDRIALLKVYGSNLDYVTEKLTIQQNAMLKMKDLAIAIKQNMDPKQGLANIDNSNILQMIDDIVAANSEIQKGINQYSASLTKITDQQIAGSISAADAERQRLVAQIKFQQDYGFLIDENKQKETNLLISQMSEESAAYAQRIKMFKEYQDAKARLEQDTAEGAKAAFQKIADSVTPFQTAFDSVTSVFDNLMSALDTFVRTGKFKFKDFAMSIIRDLIMIELRAKAVALFKAIGMSIFGLAGGGPASAGKPYIVGENGPELFVPKASGTVIPNGQLMGKGAGGSGGAAMAGPISNTYITNNISAVDAKGVAQLFAENRKTLLGTVRYAQKEQSYRFATY